jgi:TolB protein
MRAIHGRQASWLSASLIAVSAGLLTTACAKPQPVAAAPPTPSASAAASPTVSVTASATATVSATSTGPSHVLKGSLYYAEVKVQRITNSTLATVLNGNSFTATVSPDGRSVAFVDDAGTLDVTTRDGHPIRTVLTDVAGAGYEPAWSPDSTKVLIWHGSKLGTVDVHTNHFTALAHDPGGIHYLWSADGQHLGYATGTCQIGIADADGGHAHLVPVLGNMNTSVNPKRKRSCDPYSISADGSRIAVNLRTGDMPDGDIGRDLFANAVIDTRTGATVSLPVSGPIAAILFQADGGMLIRSTVSGHYRLTLTDAQGHITALVTESTAVRNMSLLAYTPL